jgi:hypothetical protein
MAEVRNHHKDFNYYFWNDDNLPELPAHLKMVYDSYQEPAIKADLLRMYVIHEYGGIYLDADFKVINGLHSNVISHEQRDGFIVYNDSYGMSALANTIFGFKKGNLLIKYMIDNVNYENQWIGPNWWVQIICKYLGLDFTQATVEELKEKVNQFNIEVVHWRDIESKCFVHEALASWMHGSIWHDKLKNGNYD